MKSENTGSQEAAMPRPRIHLSAAERTAAWRKRNAHKMPERQRDITHAARDLCTQIRIQALEGDEQCQKLIAEKDTDILKNLIKQLMRNVTHDIL
jgi:hypothetical protein